MTGTPNLNKGTSEAPQDVAALPQTETGKRAADWMRSFALGNPAVDRAVRLIADAEREAAAGQDRAAPRTEAAAEQQLFDLIEPLMPFTNAEAVRRAVREVIAETRREAAAAPALDQLVEARRRLAEPKNPWRGAKAVGWEAARNTALVVIDGLIRDHRLSPPPVAAVAEDPAVSEFVSFEGTPEEHQRARAMAARFAGDRDRREAAAPGAAALDRGLVRLAMNAAWTAPHDFEAAVEVFIREYNRLGARAAEPKPPESRE